MIEQVSGVERNSSVEITSYVKEVEFTKNGVSYSGNLYWDTNYGFTFFSNDEDKDPELTYEEMLLIDGLTDGEDN